jgi:hypothetical protein
VLDHLCAFLLGYFVYLSQEDEQRLKVKQLDDALLILIDAFKEHLMDLGIALTNVGCFVGILIHGLDDGI